MTVSVLPIASPATPYSPFSALAQEVIHRPSSLRDAITNACRKDERGAVQWLLSQVSSNRHEQDESRELAHALVEGVRGKRSRASGMDALMHEFSLSSAEGIALMCLAEALLRIPDRQTADRLIADKIGKGDWHKHLGGSPSLFVNAATWGLLMTGKLVATASEQQMRSALARIISKGGEPLIRKGVDLAMRMLGRQFVTGQTIEEALENGKENEARGYRYSFDMLGEAALTGSDAAAYYASYEHAIHAIGRAANGRGIKEGPGISVKLSALHPRYTRSQRARVMQELLPRLKQLVLLAKKYDVGINIDAEEADRLELSLDLLEALVQDPELSGFDGIGFVVQAYQKRCPYVIDYLIDLARRNGRRLMVRLVKGAYWDAEIKRTQVDGLSGYPVYTRKVYTDVSYIACAQRLLSATDAVYPQFATHNALTLATIYTHAQAMHVTDYEFQCLHGMGEALYDQVIGKDNLDKPCRIYAPVGTHQTLLAYLVRRLLENGANSSFVNQVIDEGTPIDALLVDPLALSARLGGAPHPGIVLPVDLYAGQRKNSSGIDFSSEAALRQLSAALCALGSKSWHAQSLLATAPAAAGTVHPILNPADLHDQVGSVCEATIDDVEAALAAAAGYASTWQAVPSAERGAALLRAADLLEAHQPELMSLAIREAGKSLPNANAEVREAVDFLRYYAHQVASAEDEPALGVVTCISPWNFPLAIFVGQVGAALAAGNVVLAKPAEQTPLIAFYATQLLHQAGIPRAALQLLPGRGETVGAALTADPRVYGVVFTGSTEVARIINRTLARRSVAEARELPLIAETGGQNAMIVDSSALPEQVVQDVLASAFDSAGQRCSALRLLCLQADIADHVLAMLKGALHEVRVGRPDRLATDIGPVIDAEARGNLLAYIEKMRSTAKAFFQLPLPAGCEHGTFVAPTIIEIDRFSTLESEVFGPVLHVLRYRREALPQLVEGINASGYGLTLGIHSRIDETIDYIVSRAHVGNVYVNRNIVGAVVGVQPFGGEGKSGTGPKAGGPLYLKRLQQGANTVLAVDAPLSPFGTDPAVAALREWARNHGHERLEVLLETYAPVSLSDRTLSLPGPTGESNMLRFAPRGNVLCVAADLSALLNQLAAALATGNATLLFKETRALIPQGFPVEALARIRTVDHIDQLPDVALALCDPASSASLLPALADCDGALVPVMIATGTQEIALWRLVAERALCINTTAAGGNASLMMLDQAG